MKKRLAQVAHEKAKKKAGAKAKKKRPLRPGQPSAYSSLDDAIENRLCEYLQAGVPIALACDATGLPRRTFYQWEEFAVQSEGAGKTKKEMDSQPGFFDIAYTNSPLLKRVAELPIFGDKAKNAQTYGAWKIAEIDIPEVTLGLTRNMVELRVTLAVEIGR